MLYQGGSIETDDVGKAAEFIRKFIEKRAELVKMLEEDGE